MRAPACTSLIVMVAAFSAAQAGTTRVQVNTSTGYGAFTSSPTFEARPAGTAEVSVPGSADLFLQDGVFLPADGTSPGGTPRYGEPVNYSIPATERAAYMDEALLLGVPAGERPIRYVSIAVAAGRDDTFDSGDVVEVEFTPDGGSAQLLGRLTASDTFSSALALDGDLDGVGEGASVPVHWRTYRFELPGGASSGVVRVLFDVDSSEEIAIDCIELRERLFGRDRAVARQGFEGAAGEWSFVTNIDPGAVGGNAVSYGGTTFAGDQFNDYVVVVPNHASRLSVTNLELGFLPAEGEGFLIAEDTSSDGLPGEVVLTFDPIDFDELPFHFEEVPAYSFAPVAHGTPEWLPGGGVDLEATEFDGYSFQTSKLVTEAAQTWMVWIRPESLLTPGGFTTEHPHTVLSAHDSSGLRGFLRIAERRIQYGWYNGSTFPLVQTVQTINVGEWVHVAGRSDGTSQPELFIDGVSVPVTTGGGGDFSQRASYNDLRIGFQNLSGNRRHFDGEVRDARFFTRALTNDEIAAAAQSPAETSPDDFQEPLRLAVVASNGGGIQGYFTSGPDILQADFDPGSMTFTATSSIRTGSLFDEIDALAVEPLAPFGVRLHYAFAPGAEGGYLPAGTPPDANGFFAYDGAGAWLGSDARRFLYTHSFSLGDLGAPDGPPEPASSDPGVPYGVSGLAFADAATFGTAGVLAASDLGQVLFYESDGDSLLEPVPAIGDLGMLFRSKESSPAIAFIETVSGTRLALGAGTLRVAEFDFDSESRPRIQAANNAERAAPELFLGMDPVLTAAPLNGDSNLDLLAGNAEGELLFVQNLGTDNAPMFAAPVPVRVDGEIFDMDAGAYRSLLGPADARKGWTSPTLFDWDSDGHADILLSGVNSEYYFLRRIPQGPGIRFERPQQILSDGLELHTTWRNQPAVTDGAGAFPPSLITFGPDNELVRYEQTDVRNVGAPILLLDEGGEPIEAISLGAAATGRVRLQSFDWDQDGLLDIIAGVRPAGDASALSGQEQDGAVVLLLRNVNTNALPRYAAPMVLSDDGAPLRFGTGECSPFVWIAGGEARMLVAEHTGCVSLIAAPPDLTTFDAWIMR